jgi:hypothetical protein
VKKKVRKEERSIWNERVRSNIEREHNKISTEKDKTNKKTSQYFFLSEKRMDFFSPSTSSQSPPQDYNLQCTLWGGLLLFL